MQKIETEEQYEEAIKESKEACRQLKKVLKLRSKSELINLVIAYGSDLREQQMLNRVLLEENNILKSEEPQND